MYVALVLRAMTSSLDGPAWPSSHTASGGLSPASPRSAPTSTITTVPGSGAASAGACAVGRA
ncbi:hypothetical protein AMK22_12775 [Streptomyces sp. CB01580]|nr:hypothetical protein AMK22_12775 [Streptomyces sp. CB01580]